MFLSVIVRLSLDYFTFDDFQTPYARVNLRFKPYLHRVNILNTRNKRKRRGRKLWQPVRHKYHGAVFTHREVIPFARLLYRDILFVDYIKLGVGIDIFRPARTRHPLVARPRRATLY